MAFPFEVTEKFIDSRVHEYKWEVEYKYFGWLIGIIIGICLTLGVATVVWLYLRKCHFFKRFSNAGKRKVLHEEAISESAKGTTTE